MANEQGNRPNSKQGGDMSTGQARQQTGSQKWQQGSDQSFAQFGQDGMRSSEAGSGASGQAQQFEQQSGQFNAGGSGADGRLIEQIREHMEVLGDDGQSLGRVDSVEGDRIKLTRSDSEDGQHHYIACSDVAGIENDRVQLHTGARSMPGNDGS